ncbi:MAG: DUF4388 domain-containing protein [Kiritimatiellae bacterium]|nr:DUF4388 domain-containing protein [Kiritimatiellia bacterium]
MRCLAAILLASPLLSLAMEELPPLTNLPPSVTHQVRVTEYGVMVPIRDFRRTCTTGMRLPLFQENEYFYIARVSTLEFGEQLCAFPKVDSLGVGTAWVTNEKLLIFGIPTRTVPGRFFLMKNDALPILDENETEYITLLERYGERIAFSIPRSVAGITREPIPPKPKVVEEVVSAEPRRITLDMETLAEISPQAAERKTPFWKRRSTTPQETLKTAPPPSRSAKPRRSEAPPAAPKDKTAVEEPAGEPAPAPASPPAEAARAKTTVGWWSRLPVTIIVLQIFVLALVAQVLLFMRRKKEPAAPAPPPPTAEDVQTFSTMGESFATNYFHTLAHEAGDFSGSLEGFSVTELVQFLHSAKETGVLLIKDVNDRPAGEFFFEQGEIIDAAHGEHRGESAIYALFRGHDASFAFNRVDVGKRSRTINQSTMGILLDASKTYDEEQEPSPNKSRRA